MILGNFLIFALFVAYGESYGTSHQQVSTSGGIKSYGGVFTDSTGQNEAASQFVSTQNYQQPALTSYQPYGWNFNQPARTYGGVNVQSRHDQERQNFNQGGNMGWVDNRYNNMGYNPMFNNFPFVPMPQFPQFPFPNFNYFPNYQPNYNQGNLPYPQQMPHHPHPHPPPMNNYPMPPPMTPDNNVRPLSPDTTQTSTIEHRVDQKKPNNNGFSTNSFFENNDDRQWSADKELQWQATTKRPFFENTVPGLGCTLPAASIIGAKDVFSAVNLLPLSVPIGKPILSCNATGLKQTDVKIKNRIYSCHDGIVNVECRNNNGNVCPGNVMICDMRGSKPIHCTNGTLLSNRDLVCKTISIGNPQSILHCDFKDEDIDVRFQEGTTTTTRAPFVVPTRRTTTKKSFNIDYDDQEALQTSNRVDIENSLTPEVKNAMKNIFPHDLLMKPVTRLLPPRDYLPPVESQASRDLVQSMRGIFPMELLVVSKSNDDSIGISTTSPYDIRLSENTNINQNIQVNNNDDGVGFKTQLSGIDTRFGGNSQQPLHQQQDFRDRLIFSN